MDWRRIFSVAWDVAQILLMIAVVVGVSTVVYFMAQARMHRHG